MVDLSSPTTPIAIKANTKKIEHFLEKNFINIRNVLFKNQFPVLIFTVLILVLLITLTSLFIVSVWYSISICRLFKCTKSNQKKPAVVNDTQTSNDKIKANNAKNESENSQVKSLLDQNRDQSSMQEFEQSQMKFKISKLFCSEQNKELLCTNICAESSEKKVPNL